MKCSRFTGTQSVSILKETDAGASVKDIGRRHGISPATWYQWQSKYGGMGASELKTYPGARSSARTDKAYVHRSTALTPPGRREAAVFLVGGLGPFFHFLVFRAN